jgi:hypothetical protein
MEVPAKLRLQKNAGTASNVEKFVEVLIWDIALQL